MDMSRRVRIPGFSFNGTEHGCETGHIGLAAGAAADRRSLRKPALHLRMSHGTTDFG